MIARAETPADQRVTVLAVGRDDVVLGLQGSHHADRDRFFTDVEVQEAADLRRAVQLDATLLEPADAQHLAVELQWLARASALIASSSVERSPSGNPSSRAREHAPHDLPAPGLRKVLGERDLLRCDRRAQALPPEPDQLEAQRVRRLEARPSA